MSWGKGGMVGVRKAIWKHDQMLKQAAFILLTECGQQHKLGEHELCPKCQEHNRKAKQQNP